MAVRTTDALPLAMSTKNRAGERDRFSSNTSFTASCRNSLRIPSLRGPLHPDTSVSLAYPTLVSTFPILPHFSQLNVIHRSSKPSLVIYFDQAQ